MPSLIPVDNILGAFLIGVVFSSMLYGVTCLQVYSYFSRHSENDKDFLKYFVAVIIIVESLQMTLLVHAIYTVGVTNFGDFVSDRTAPWSLRAQVLIGNLITGAIQQFYAWRIYQFSRRQTYIPSFIVVTSFAAEALGVAFFVRSFRYRNYQQNVEQKVVAIPILALQVACDLTITASMVYYLYTRCTRAKQTITATTTLALYSIISGALALVFSISCLITFVRFAGTLIFVPFFFVLMRIYVCAFMALLNSRDRIRTKLSEEAKDGIMITISRFADAQNPSGDDTASGSAMDIVNSVMDQSTADSTSQKNLVQVRDESPFPLPSEV